jgi:hypothetical protein
MSNHYGCCNTQDLIIIMASIPEDDIGRLMVLKTYNKIESYRDG